MRKPKAKHLPKREVFIDACRIQNCHIHERTGDIKGRRCVLAYVPVHRDTS